MNCSESPRAHPGQSDMSWPLHASTLTKLNLGLFRSKVCPSIINIWKRQWRVPNTTPVLTRVHSSTRVPAELDPVRVWRGLGAPDPSIESSRRTLSEWQSRFWVSTQIYGTRGFRPILLSTDITSFTCTALRDCTSWRWSSECTKEYQSLRNPTFSYYQVVKMILG